MQPSRRRHSFASNTGNPSKPEIYLAGEHGDFGRSVSPTFVEDVISNTKPIVQENGNLSHTSGSLQIITNTKGNVVTIITH